MKILYVANIRVPTERAHGAQIMNTCHAFAACGEKVKLCVTTRKNHLETDAFAYYQLERNFTIERVSTPNPLWLGKIGFYLSNLWFTLSVLRYVWSFKPDVVYGRDKVPLLWLSYWHRRVFWEAHGGKWNLPARLLARRVQGIITLTQGTKSYFVERGVQKHAIHVAPDGLGRQFFDEKISKEEARSRLGLPIEPYLVMYIGLLDSWKGYQTLLDASEKLLDKGVRVVIIGGFGDQVRELKLHYPHVIFTGFLPYADLAKNQRAADVLVIPNSGHSEVSRTYTSPLKLFAHMASGVPLIVSYLPSMREILNESMAYFFEPDNSNSLAETIQYALSHDEKSEKKSAQALSKVKEYTWEKRALAILKFIS